MQSVEVMRFVLLIGLRCRIMRQGTRGGVYWGGPRYSSLL